MVLALAGLSTTTTLVTLGDVRGERRRKVATAGLAVNADAQSGCLRAWVIYA